MGAIAAFAVAAVFLSVALVPEGSHGFRRLRGEEPWTVLEPGIHPRLPFLHELRISPDELTVRDRPGAGGEGGGIDYAVTARLSREALERSAGDSSGSDYGY